MTFFCEKIVTVRVVKFAIFTFAVKFVIYKFINLTVFSVVYKCIRFVPLVLKPITFNTSRKSEKSQKRRDILKALTEG